MTNRILRRLAAYWNTLTRPSPQLLRPDQIRQARALAGTTLAFLPLMLVLTFVSLPLALSELPNSRPLDQPMFYLGLTVIAATLATYLLSRSRHYLVGGQLFVGAVMTAIYLSALLGDIDDIGRIELLTWLAFGMLLGSFYLTVSGTIVLGILSVVAVLLFPALSPTLAHSDLVGVLSYVTVMSVASAILKRQRDQLEADRHHLLVSQQAELEGRVTERTAELEQANRHLEALSRVKDEFVANVSHELRTPITSIKLHHELLRRDPGRSRVFLERLDRETKRLEQIVEALLQISRLDQRQFDIQPEPCDLNVLVQQMMEDRIALGRQKCLVISVDTGDALPCAQADPAQTGQVLSILLTNALNYTPSGGQVALRTGQREMGGRRFVGFSVSDTGPGIPPDERARLFERFFRGQAGRNSGVAGTGLGLAIARKIVDLQGGHIEVASDGQSGQGATFRVWLPVANDPGQSGGM